MLCQGTKCPRPGVDLDQGPAPVVPGTDLPSVEKMQVAFVSGRWSRLRELVGTTPKVMVVLYIVAN